MATTLALSPGAVEPAAELELLRIVQEALSDVRKHAAAAHVRAALSAHDAAMQVEIADDGRGFDPQATRSSRSFACRS